MIVLRPYQIDALNAARVRLEPVIPNGTHCIAQLQLPGDGGAIFRNAVVEEGGEGKYSRIYRVRFGPGEWDIDYLTRHEIFLPS